MNCRTALNILEAARPDSGDFSEPEVEPAVVHLEGCPDCEAALERRWECDRAIVRLMCDVPVPEGLKERLLAAVELDDAACSHPLQRVERPPEGSHYERSSASRRTWLKVAGSLAACAAVVFVAWLVWPAASDGGFTLADLRNEVPLDLENLAGFEGEFHARPPGGPWQTPAVEFTDAARGCLKDKQGNHRVALYGFLARDGMGGQVRGAMAVLPRSALADAPGNSAFSGDFLPEHYTQRGSGQYDTAAWSEGEMVYVCFLPKDRGGENVQILRRALFPPPA